MTGNFESLLDTILDTFFEKTAKIRGMKKSLFLYKLLIESILTKQAKTR
jgi:hypothetical protein